MSYCDICDSVDKAVNQLLISSQFAVSVWAKVIEYMVQCSEERFSYLEGGACHAYEWCYVSTS